MCTLTVSEARSVVIPLLAQVTHQTRPAGLLGLYLDAPAHPIGGETGRAYFG